MSEGTFSHVVAQICYENSFNLICIISNEENCLIILYVSHTSGPFNYVSVIVTLNLYIKAQVQLH